MAIIAKVHPLMKNETTFRTTQYMEKMQSPAFLFLKYEYGLNNNNNNT